MELHRATHGCIAAAATNLVARGPLSGKWPTRVSIQRLDGLRSTLHVDPHEAVEVATELLARLVAYNRRIADGESPEALASPSADTCAHCDYRVACPPFFRTLDESWGWYRRALLGKVVGRADMGDIGVLKVAVEASNLAPNTQVARVLGIPPDLMPSLGSRVAVVDGIPTAAPQDVRAVWDTQLLEWSS